MGARVSVAICALVLGLATAMIPAQALTSGGDPSARSARAAVTPACAAATKAVTSARTALARAKKALRKARTPAAKRRARTRVTKAQRQLTTAQAKRKRACAAPPAPTAPTQTTPTQTTPTQTTPTQPTPTQTTPTQPTPPPPANRPPVFPTTMHSEVHTNIQYDDLGHMIGATTTIAVSPPATDPDGDPLTYSWTSSNGSIVGDGLSATWTRVIVGGWPASGTATVTANDGRGGTDSFSISD